MAEETDALMVVLPEYSGSAADDLALELYAQELSRRAGVVQVDSASGCFSARWFGFSKWAIFPTF